MTASPFITGPQLSPTLCLQKNRLKSTSTTNHLYDVVTHLSSSMRISNFLEKLYSPMSQGLDVQITFEEENVNFTHTDKHQKL